MVLGKLSVPGLLLIWIKEGQGPTVLAVGAGGVVWTFFSHLSFLFSFSLSLGPIYTEILPQRAIKPKTTNQPIHPLYLNASLQTFIFSVYQYTATLSNLSKSQIDIMVINSD